jgi:SAM-dependent methyltransferase
VGHWGRLVGRALERPLHLVGVDREAEWIGEAFARARDLPGHWRYQTGDAHHLPFADASFDLVTCQTVLIHLADPAAALAEWRRVLRPGARLVVAEPNNIATHAARVAEDACAGGDLDGALRELRFIALCERGKAALGLGFNSIGELVPGMLAAAGLTLLGSSICDRVVPLVPPYDAPAARAEVAELERFQENDAFCWPRPEAERYFVAGGGSDFVHEWSFVRARQSRRLEGLRAGRRVVASGSLLYVHGARK